VGGVPLSSMVVLFSALWWLVVVLP